MPKDPREPALSPKQWKAYQDDRHRIIVEGFGGSSAVILGDTLDHAAAIAINNDLLEHDDPRKITRATLVTLRSASDLMHVRHGNEIETKRRLDAFTLALESYLAPERHVGQLHSKTIIPQPEDR